MQDTAFEALSLRIGRVVDSVASDLNERGIVHAMLTLLPRDGCILAIRKPESVVEMVQAGSFAFRNDPDPGMVRIEIADGRKPTGLPFAEKVNALEMTADTIRTRIAEFVRDWLAS
jgi:hypothetical protein